jgi:proteasome lid subunit RPN8/RPN11
MKPLRGGEASVLPADEPSILWQESEHGYKPVERPLADFLSGRGIAVNQKDAPLLVFMRQDCIQAMEVHAGQDILREQAGILCGQAYFDPSGQHYIEVTAAVAVETLNSSSYFRFHERSWQSVWEKMGDESNILGWYHSHPGMGIFLSATDLRTQELYFSASWQIAVVLDPVSREVGTFHRDQRIQILTID